MAVRFTPSGNLDVTTDPQELPEVKGTVLTGDPKAVVSGAMTRCTNLHLDRAGIASTRKGTSKVNATALASIRALAITSGDRYAFTGPAIYKNEASIISGLTNADWSALVYKAYNATLDSIFALNGTNRKRITDGVAYEWGLDAPTVAPTVTKSINWVYTHDWEGENYSYSTIPAYTYDNSEAYTSGTWEADYCDDPTTAYYAYILQSEHYYSTPIKLYSWEGQLITGVMKSATTYLKLDGYLRKFTTLHGNYDIMYSWEGETLDADESTFPHDYSSEWMYWFEQGLDDDEAEFQVKYTWCRKSGDVLECESNPSPPASLTIDSGGVVIFEAAPDTQVTHARIYRTLADGGNFYYHSEVAIDAEYTVLTKRDSQLGAEVEIDHDRPPLGSVVAGPNYDGSCFIILNNNLYYCKPKQPEYWPALYYIEVSRPDDGLMAVTYVGSQAFCASSSQIYQIQGTGVASFFPLPMKAHTGTLSKQCFCSIVGQGIFHLGIDGIYQFKIGSDVKISDSEFQTVFDGETAGSIPGLNRTYIANCWMISAGGKLWFGFPGGTDTYPADVLVMDLQTKRTVHYQYPFYIRTVEYDAANTRILAGCTDGYIRVIEDRSIVGDDGTVISWQIESKEFGGLRKYFPRFARYDVSLGSAATANGYILLDGTVKQTHAITESRKTRKRLVDGCTGDRLSLRMSGTGDVDIYGMEAE